MSNYVKATNFTTKDTLNSGDPNKIVKGTELDTEFIAIASAIQSKADLASPALTGVPTAPTAEFLTNTAQLATTAFVQAAMQAAYPVGSIYINASSSTNPGTLLGFGTWEAFGAGRVMVGLNASDALFDTLEETGGSKDAITVAHTHTYSGTTSNKSLTGSFSNIEEGFVSASGVFARGPNGLRWYGGNPTTAYGASMTIDASHDHTFSGTTASTGSSGTNANLQPYITVRMWKRTA